jgi:hypothetical protein
MPREDKGFIILSTWRIKMFSGMPLNFGTDLGFYFLILFGLFWMIIAILGLIIVLENLPHHKPRHLNH